MIHKHDWTNSSKLVFSEMEIHSVENSDVNKKQTPRNERHKKIKCTIAAIKLCLYIKYGQMH